MSNTTYSGTDIFKLIDQYPVLEDAKQRDLARRAHAGDTHARDLMVLHNLRLVVEQIKKFIQPFPSDSVLGDIVHEAIAGLTYAVDKYDPDRGFTFPTYSVNWIKQAIRLWMFAQNKVYVSRHTHDEMIKISKAMASGCTKPEDIAKKTKVSLEHVTYVQKYMKSRVVSLDNAVVNDDGQEDTFGAFLADNEDPYELIYQQSEDVTRHEEASLLLEVLNPAQRRVICQLYGLEGYREMTMEAAAKEIGISRQRIQQHKNAALQKMYYAGIMDIDTNIAS